MKKIYQFKNDKHGVHISKMCTDIKFTRLFVADNEGFISNWNIENYARKQKEINPPNRKHIWHFILFFFKAFNLKSFILFK